MPALTDLTPDAAPGTAVALILPGANYSTQAPLLYWSIGVLLESGRRVIAADWIASDRELGSPEALIAQTIDEATKLAGRAPAVIIAKSIGTLALPWAVSHGILGVWLTPLLDRAAVADAAQTADARHLFVGGTRDRHWIPDAGAERLEIPGADHSLRRDGWQDSLRIEAEVVARIAAHIETELSR